jgi:adenylylsulfate kinase-like enzyme
LSIKMGPPRQMGIREVFSSVPKGSLRQGKGRENRKLYRSRFPYEAPDSPEVRVTTIGVSPEIVAEQVLDELRDRKII